MLKESSMRRMFLLSIALATSAFAAELPYRQVEGWRQPVPPGREWGKVTGLAVGTKGQIYVLREVHQPPVVELDAETGKVLRMWGTDEFVTPHLIRVDKQGFLWIIDTNVKDGRGGVVTKFSVDGKPL